MKKVKTLIVEDEVVVARDLQLHLEQMGYSATSTVPSGEQAIQEIENEVPDLVLMDIVLQDEIDGVETAEIMHSRFDIPVIFITAQEDNSIFERAIKTGPFGYINKPFQWEELRKAIKIALFRHKSEQEKEALARKQRKKTEYKLREQKKSLQRKSIALGEVLRQVKVDKRQMEDNVIANAENLLLPIIQKLRQTEESRKYIELLQSCLKELTSSFGTRMSDKKAGLTSKEIEICNLIRSGLTSKEIAALLNTSLQTVEKHRSNIRSKLGLANKKVSLSSTLRTL